MHQYKELKVWTKSIEFTVDLYHATQLFPKEETYSLVSQVKKAAVSISSNIAEGAGRKSNKEFSQFLSYSYGSTCEVDTQLIIARRLRFIDEEKFENLNGKLQEIQKMLFSLKNQI